jgi:hypothetical protein
MKEEKEVKVKERLTENELMVRLKVFIGGCLAVTLIGIVFTVLYSVMFVTQPLNAISPVDQKFFELIIPIATFLTGTLSGIMLAGTGENAALAGAKSNMPKPTPAPVPPKPVTPPPSAKKEDEFLDEEIG